MKEYSKEERSRVYSEADKKELETLHGAVSQSRWRCDYHVQPLTGLMNDPNGFARFSGRWHLFYQWFPYGPVHGIKHWYHVTSEDLVHWKNEGLAIKPELLYENSGCYSGTALAKDDVLWLYYTGNNRDFKNVRHQYQLLAKMDKMGRIEKRGKPLIYPEEDFSEHQRDPKIFEYSGKYYILLGMRTLHDRGTLLLYSAEKPGGGFRRLGELKVRGYPSFGYMCECPDIERIGDKWLLLFSPQGIEPDGYHFHQKFNNVYLIGDFDPENLEFIPDGPYYELDRGFDFYAAQCACQNEFADAAVMEAWFSGPDYTVPPTEEEGWAHIMTMPRILTIENGKLIQRPVPAAKEIEGDVLFKAENGTIVEDRLHGLMPSACVIHLENPGLQNCELSLFSRNGARGFEISYDRSRKFVTVDRGSLTHVINPEFGTKREIHLDEGLERLDIYVDHSSIEIFMNDGARVVSARVFPEPDERILRMGGRDINLLITEAKQTVEDNFII